MKNTLLATACALLAAPAAFAASGAPDTTFGGGMGFTINPIASTPPDFIRAMAIQSDGKILVAGQSDGNFGLARVDEEGVLDAGFGSGGTLRSAVTDYAGYVMGLDVQTDGKIIAFGQGSTAAAAFGQSLLVARYLADGTLDTTFGSEGAVLLDIVDGKIHFGVGGLLQSDGKIVLAGSVTLGPFSSDFAVARFTTSGALDTTFSTDGKATFDLGSSQNDSLAAIAQQSTGKLILVGTRNNSDFALIRVNDDGTLDTSFGSGGIVVQDVSGTSEYANAVAIQSDDKIIVAGSYSAKFVLARYTANGNVDTTFGSNGIVEVGAVGLYATVGQVAVDAKGRIVVAGYSGDYTKNTPVLMRVTSTGALDTTFGTSGRALDLPNTGDDEFGAVALDGSGRIVVAGVGLGESTKRESLVARFKSEADPSPANAKPVLKLKGPKSLTTKAASVTIKGTASDDSKVAKVLVNKKAAKGTAAWSYKAALKAGKNKLVITAVDDQGVQSAPVTVTVLRKK